MEDLQDYVVGTRIDEVCTMKFIFSRSKKIAKIDYSQIVKDSPRISLGFFLTV